MLIDIVKANRSYRGYDESYVFTKEDLLDLVNITRFVPSSVNKQPFKFYVSYEKEEVALIQSMTKWAAALPDMTLPHPGMCPTGFIVMCQDLEINENPMRYSTDIGIVAQTLLLYAAEKGLGGCMIGNFKPDEVKEKLSLNDNFHPVLIIALGKPKEKIVLTDLENGQNSNYYRDGNDVHYVPKRKLEDIVING